MVKESDITKEKKMINLYYSHIGDGYLLDALKNYCNAQGFGIEDVWCVFSNEYEPWEEDYFGETGIAYYFDYPAVEKDEVLILDYTTFYNYLLNACNDYIYRNPNDELEAKKYLNEIGNKFEII
jgi:hypothetical protein